MKAFLVSDGSLPTHPLVDLWHKYSPPSRWYKEMDPFQPDGLWFWLNEEAL